MKIRKIRFKKSGKFEENQKYSNLFRGFFPDF